MTMIVWFNHNQQEHTAQCHQEIYFGFNNGVVKVENEVYTGFVLKLFDGIMFSYDARVLFHCTTKSACNCNYNGVAIVGNAMTSCGDPGDQIVN